MVMAAGRGVIIPILAVRLSVVVTVARGMKEQVLTGRRVVMQGSRKVKEGQGQGGPVKQVQGRKGEEGKEGGAKEGSVTGQGRGG